mmetsp:Transcript_4525/g.7012  ORF Transcript_4525/g.7012 Transcript_4525/m.7012 type:complete len:427 (-) Transcript_4525:56-1336(-)
MIRNDLSSNNLSNTTYPQEGKNYKLLRAKLLRQHQQSPGCARSEKVNQYNISKSSSASDRTVIMKNLSSDEELRDDETKISSCGNLLKQRENETVVSSPFQPPAAYVIRKVNKLLPLGYSLCPRRAVELPFLFNASCLKKPDLYYDKAITGMIYSEDVDSLRKFHQQGLPLHLICNEYGDTLLHIACRYVNLRVVQFLVEEAGASAWVHDARGQTPLHCACHSTDPMVLELMDFVLNAQEDHANLLFIQDEEGLLPLDYAPREIWSTWVKFFRRKGLAPLAPTQSYFYYMPSGIHTTKDDKEILDVLVQVNRFLALYASDKKKELKQLRRKSTGNASAAAITMEMRYKRLKKKLCQAILNKIQTLSRIRQEEIRSFQQILTLPLDQLYDEFQNQRDLVRSESQRDLMPNTTSPRRGRRIKRHSSYM